MNWTTLLAAFGAITGAAGLSWQVLNYRLTGGRLQVLAMYFKKNDHLQVLTDVINVGRLDLSVLGYAVWADVSGQRLRKLRWRVGTTWRAGILHARRAYVTFPPSASFHAPVVLGDGERTVEFPAIVRSGSTLTLPQIGIGWPDHPKRRLRVAIVLGTGRIIRVYPISMDAFRPIQIVEGNSTGIIKVEYAKSSTSSIDVARDDDD